jgi:segregation and condensation protein A
MPEYKVELEQFSGPLHLLLELIQERKLDITQVSLAEVAEQFLTYVQQQAGMDPEVAADFLVVASRLMLIKSRALLPEFSAQTEEEANELEQQLKLYREFVAASQVLEQMIASRQFTYGRQLPTRLLEPRFSPPAALSAAGLATAYAAVVAGLQAFIRLPQRAMQRMQTVAERLQQLIVLVAERAKMTFTSLLGNPASRIERVLNFLALLEMVKQSAVQVQQVEHHGEIHISRV